MRQCLVVLLLLLAACTPTEAPPPTATPVTGAWGAPRLLATVPSVYAPAVMADSERTWWAWTEAREGEQRHIAANPNDSTILAVKAWYPFGYQILPAANGNAHLFWLDRTQDDVNNLRLQSTLVDQDRVAQLEAKPLAPNAVYHFSAVGMDEGEALVVWSEGIIGAEQLAMIRLDGVGRGAFRVLLNVYGQYPVLSRTNEGDVWLFWLAEGGLWRGRLVGEALEQTERLMDAPSLASGERLEGLQAAFDGGRAYVLWQVVNDKGVPFVWMASGGRLAASWSKAQRLTFNELPFTTQTGYNGGAATATSTGNGHRVGWATMATGQHSPLPVAVTVGDDLAVLYLQNGEPIAIQRLWEVGRLFSAPTIATNDERHLWVGWSQPQSAEVAALGWVGTERE